MSLTKNMVFADPQRNLITVEYVTITPDMAAEMLRHNHPDNRPIRDDKVQQRVRDLQTGGFLFTGDTIKFDSDGRLIDGQHRLQAIIEADIAGSSLVVRGLAVRVITVLDQATPREVAQILAMSGRSLKHAAACIAVQQIIMHGDKELSRDIGNRSRVADIVWGNREALTTWVTWAQRLYATSDLYINPNHPFAQGKNTRRAISQSPLAVLGLIMASQGADASPGGDMDRFFEAIVTGMASDESLRQTSMALRRYFQVTRPLINTGGGNQYPNLYKIFDTVIRTYNRWLAGEPVHRVQEAKNVSSISNVSNITKALPSMSVDDTPVIPEPALA